MNTIQPGGSAPASLEEFPTLNCAITKSVQCVKKTVAIVFEYTKKITALALTIILAALFPGSFILGTCSGLLIGVIARPERIKESLGTISKIWQRQSWLMMLPFLGMAFFGLPYTIYLTAIVRGTYLGINEALKAKNYERQ